MSEQFDFDKFWKEDAPYSIIDVPTADASTASPDEAPQKPKRKRTKKVHGAEIVEPAREPERSDVPIKVGAKVRRARRLPTAQALEKEMAKLRSERGAVDTAAAMDPVVMGAEIRAAADRSVALLEKLDAVLSVADAATEEMTKYAQLIGSLERNAGESAVIERVCAVFRRLIHSTTQAKNSCTRLPNEFAQMLIRHNAFMRATTSALVPHGISVITSNSAPSATPSTDASGQQVALVASSGPTALVKYGGRNSSSAFTLTSADLSQTQVTELQNTYMATSTMHADFNPQITATAANAAQRSVQRRAAFSKKRDEFVSEAGVSERLALIGSSVLRLGAPAAATETASSSLMTYPAQLAIEAQGK